MQVLTLDELLTLAQQYSDAKANNTFAPCNPDFLIQNMLVHLVRLKGETATRLPKFCTIKNMNFNGDLIYGELKNEKTQITSYYMLDDGDCYRYEALKKFDVVFSNDDPRVKP